MYSHYAKTTPYIQNQVEKHKGQDSVVCNWVLNAEICHQILTKYII